MSLILFNRFFPKIFGKNEDLPLDFEGSWAAFKKLTDEVIFISTPLSCHLLKCFGGNSHIHSTVMFLVVLW